MDFFVHIFHPWGNPSLGHVTAPYKTSADQIIQAHIAQVSCQQQDLDDQDSMLQWVFMYYYKL